MNAPVLLSVLSLFYHSGLFSIRQIFPNPQKDGGARLPLGNPHRRLFTVHTYGVHSSGVNNKTVISTLPAP